MTLLIEDAWAAGSSAQTSMLEPPVFLVVLDGLEAGLLAVVAWELAAVPALLAVTGVFEELLEQAAKAKAPSAKTSSIAVVVRKNRFIACLSGNSHFS